MSNNISGSSTSKRPANSGNGEEEDDGILAKRKKTMNNTAFVQIAIEPAIGPFHVVLSRKCSTVEEHASFLRDKINQSQGAILDGKLKLDGPMALVAVIMNNLALIDYDVQLDEASMYTFHFKLATGEEEAENRPNLVEQLATQVAQLEGKMASHFGTLTKLIGVLAEKMEEMRGQLEELKKEKHVKQSGQEPNARLRIPNEVWTDVMKLLPRRFLVKLIAPVCYRFKEISDKNVKNVHVIKRANWFSYKLKENDAIAKKQMEQLAGNNCQLADQFRLTEFRVIEENKAVMSQCPDLFNGCRISLHFNEKNKSSTLFFESLEKIKPIDIIIFQRLNQVIDFWHHPTFLNLNCTRVRLAFWSSLSAFTVRIAFVNIFEWLHHQSNEMDCDASAAADQQVRCMSVSLSEPNHIEWLIIRCSQNLQNSHSPADRRPYVFSFLCWDPDLAAFGQFHRIENKSTGEILVLDHVMNAYGGPTYRLRRCLAEEEANGKEFYAGMFKQDYGYDEFSIGDGTPKVVIR